MALVDFRKIGNFLAYTQSIKLSHSVIRKKKKLMQLLLFAD